MLLRIKLVFKDEWRPLKFGLHALTDKVELVRRSTIDATKALSWLEILVKHGFARALNKRQ